jgi:hypothetical protein
MNLEWRELKLLHFEVKQDPNLNHTANDAMENIKSEDLKNIHQQQLI